MTDTSDLVERLLEPITMSKFVSKYHLISELLTQRKESATALTAKDKEIEALRADLHDALCRFEELEFSAEATSDELKARAETAERELERERETFQRHEQTLRDNGIASHSEAVILVTTLRRERDEAMAALKPLAERITEGEATGPLLDMDEIWVSVGHLRAVRAVIKQGE